MGAYIIKVEDPGEGAALISRIIEKSSEEGNIVNGEVKKAKNCYYVEIDAEDKDIPVLENMGIHLIPLEDADIRI